MTDASRWRLEMARRMAEVYSQDSRVEAIAVGGSVGRGCADRWSDVEIGVYWSEEPTADERRAMAEQFGVLDGEPRPFELDAEELGSEESDDDVYVGGGIREGTNVEFKHKTLAGVEAFLEAWERDGVPQDTRFPETMQTAIGLYNEALVGQWKTRCAEYPDALVEQELANCLAPGGLYHLSQVSDSGDFIGHRHLLIRLIVGLIDSLCAINRHYSPSYKWNAWTLNRLNLKPDHAWERIQSVFSQPADAASILTSLLEDCTRLSDVYSAQWMDIRERLASETADPGLGTGELTETGEARIGEAIRMFEWAWSNRVSFYCFRGDMFHYAMFVRRARSLLRLVGALNGINEETSSFRWVSILPKFGNVPERFEDRLRAAFSPDLPEGQATLDGLIEDALLLARNVYDPDFVNDHLHQFRVKRRPAWDGPPDVDFLK